MGGANKFTVYTVQGEDNNGTDFNYAGNIALLRRYSDFDLLREVLVHRWPGVYIPSLPSKKTIGTNDYLFVENRRKALETFLQYMAKKSFLW